MPRDESLANAYEVLHATRPTAINLRWALDRMKRVVAPLPADQRAEAAWAEAAAICDEDVQTNHAIGHHALALFTSDS